jgi:hypothetical protein
MSEEPLDIFGGEATKLRDQLAKVRHRHINTWLSAARRLHDAANSIIGFLNQPQVRLTLSEFLGEDDIQRLKEKANNLSQTAFPLICIGNSIRQNPANGAEEVAKRADLVERYRQAVIDCAEQLLSSLADAFLEPGNMADEDLSSLLMVLRAEVDINKWVSICRSMRRLVLRYNSEFGEIEDQAINAEKVVKNALFERKSLDYLDYSDPRRNEFEARYRKLHSLIKVLADLERDMYCFLNPCDVLLTMFKTYQKLFTKAKPSSIAAMSEAVSFFADYRGEICERAETYLEKLEEAKAAAATLAPVQ